jgi:hypothetical protein
MNGVVNFSYDRYGVVPQNRVGRYGGTAYNKTDSGFGLFMISMFSQFALVPGIITSAVGLAHGGNAIALISVLVFLALIEFAIFFTDGAALYARYRNSILPKTSFRDTRNLITAGDYTAVESNLAKLTKSERSLTDELFKKMNDCIKQGEFHDAKQRADRINTMAKELIAIRPVTKDDSDILAADEFIRMMREQRSQIE